MFFSPSPSPQPSKHFDLRGRLHQVHFRHLGGPSSCLPANSRQALRSGAPPKLRGRPRGAAPVRCTIDSRSPWHLALLVLMPQALAYCTLERTARESIIFEKGSRRRKARTTTSHCLPKPRRTSQWGEHWLTGLQVSGYRLGPRGVHRRTFSRSMDSEGASVLAACP